MQRRYIKAHQRLSLYSGVLSPPALSVILVSAWGGGAGRLGGGPLGGYRMMVGHLGGTGRNKCGTLGRLGGTRFVRSI